MNLSQFFRNQNTFPNEKQIEMTMNNGGLLINDYPVTVPWDSDYDRITLMDGTHTIEVKLVDNYRLTNDTVAKYKVEVALGELISCEELF